MRAYFNYQALTYGNSFTLPDDVGYLNCIPLKMENYGFEMTYDGDDEEEEEENPDEDGERRKRQRRRRNEEEKEEEDEEEKEQAILYAKVGCLSKETMTSTAFQLHVFTDDKCTEPYDDGQTAQQHARSGYQIDLDSYYAANLEDDDAIKYTNYPKNTLKFSTKVSFKPSFYKCQTCKPSQISNTFNKFAGNFYDDDFISRYGMTRSAYADYLAEMEAQQAAANCDNCQYFTYNNDDGSDDYTVQKVDDAYFQSVDDFANYDDVFVDDYNNHDDNYNGRRLGLAAAVDETPKKAPALVPVETELKVR